MLVHNVGKAIWNCLDFQVTERESVQRTDYFEILFLGIFDEACIPRHQVRYPVVTSSKKNFLIDFLLKIEVEKVRSL